MSKRVFIKTYGCQMNVYDSSCMAELLTPLGYQTTQKPEGADLVILNTCHIRKQAAEKVFSELGQIRLLKNAKAKSGGHMLIAVGGCLAQAEGAELLRRAPFVDIVFGPQTYHRLPEFVARAARASGRGILETSFPPESKFDYLPQAGAAPGVSAFLSVQEGCDKFCTFCVVPYTRGAEYSRPAAQILAEARRLVAFGAREITLLGQNVSAYHGAGPNGGKWGLGDLLRALSVVPGLERLRYTTSHPRDVEESLIAAHRELPKLMPFLHLPVQSGSDRVLTLMNRRHTADDYRRIVERLRRARPDLALSSDFIVGFAGESEEDFAATLALVREIGFAQGFSFKYSPRPGTPAAAASGQVPEPQKAERLTLLQGLLREQQRRFNDGFLGRVQPVLLERRGRHPGQLAGKSPHHQSVHVMAGKERLGEIVPVLVRQSGGGSLGGTLAEALSQ